jgi:choice-of-anchor A domain-containing protein/uncharacterized repeat protein (TIGR01451 family)
MIELKRYFLFFLIVLNLPLFANTGNLYYTKNDSCDLSGFITFTQGGWSSPPNSQPGEIRDQYFDLVFPDNLVIGSNFTLTLTSANAVMLFLPQGGTPYKFTENYINPQINTSAGLFGGQLTAAMLNYHFNLEGYLGSNPYFNLGQLVIVSGPFAGKTVVQLLVIARHAIGGEETLYTYSQISDALASVNENFNDGQNNGFLTCPPLPAAIGDRVWFDINRNGIQDEGETGIGGVTVELYNCNDLLQQSVLTEANGYYLFADLEPGNYYIKFIKPADYTFTSADQGSDDSKDSDADPVTGKTVCTNLSDNEHDMTWDAGMYTTYASIGDKVWLDSNQDGFQDESEDGVSGVVVRLFDCDDILKNTTQTNQNGLYLFENLLPGNYYIQFVLPENYSFSPADQGSNDMKDSDADVITGKTICTLLSEDESDLSWDAGIYILDTNYADLSLIKTVNNENPQNEDIIKFTVKVTNDGPAEATNVKVIDILSDKVIYLSYTASQGSYDTASGIWTVGSLNAGAFATLEITVQVDIDSTSNNIINLGPAKGFNLFVLNDVNQPSSDTQGKMAVGRDAYLAGYSVGDMLANSNGTVDVLIVGRDLTFISGAVYGGNVVYGGTSNLPVPSVSVIHGSVRQDSVIDFDAARIYLQSLSNQLASYVVTGTTEFQWGTLTLTGADPVLNIFEVTGTQLSSANNFEINVPTGSVVLVNISGNNINWMGGLSVNGTSFTNVLYNFTEAGQLYLHGIDVKGSILAPFTDINFQAGVQHGQMIAKSLTGMGQFNLSFFLGHIPGGGTIVNTAEVYFADQYDPDSTPNNGVETEDDFGKVIVNVGGTGGTGNWQYVGSFLSGEMVLALLNDSQGNIYAGTLGGKIYKSADGGATWNRINNSMNAIYIWTLVFDSYGNLFAGTELGVYKSIIPGEWQMTSLSDKDIRSIKIDNTGNIFAGAWGYGIYKSADGGLTWASKNNGLISSAVHALLISGSKIFAATLDLGIYVSEDGGESWFNSNIGYQYVWSLGRTSAGTLFAGTYGNGLYRSEDNGDNWTKINNLAASFIYQIVIDADDNIFVSSWTGGVFGSSDNGNTWSGLGMPGSRVSSLLSKSGSAIYAGTADGRLFRNSSITSVSEEIEAPVDYALMQNYPNPFNPVTTIRFSIPAAGNYSLKIFNILGQEVKVLTQGYYNPGRYSVVMDASSLSSGVYFYSLTGDKVNIIRKMMLVK